MNLLIYILFPIASICSNIYNEDLVKDSLLISQNTYCDNNEINKESLVEKVLETDYDKAIIGYNTKYDSIFVAFRGSNNIQDWINNFHISKIYPYDKYENVGVENGFYSIYKTFELPIFSNIVYLSIKYNTSNLILTGHSLGAALSTLLAFDILNDDVYEGFNIHSIITFGSPRVGNYEFSNAIKNINSFRITHYYDIVPHLPQELLNYYHIGQEVWYNEDNTEYKICDDEDSEDKSCSNSCAPTKCTSTSDHLNYLNFTMGSEGEC